jgi:hypothetical protein
VADDLARARHFLLDLAAAQIQRFQLGLQGVREIVSGVIGGRAGPGGGFLEALFRLRVLPGFVLQVPAGGRAKDDSEEHSFDESHGGSVEFTVNEGQPKSALAPSATKFSAAGIFYLRRA